LGFEADFGPVWAFFSGRFLAFLREDSWIRSLSGSVLNTIYFLLNSTLIRSINFLLKSERFSPLKSARAQGIKGRSCQAASITHQQTLLRLNPKHGMLMSRVAKQILTKLSIKMVSNQIGRSVNIYAATKGREEILVDSMLSSLPVNTGRFGGYRHPFIVHLRHFPRQSHWMNVRPSPGNDLQHAVSSLSCQVRHILSRVACPRLEDN
jgi:hypothetical protein